jgi:uncharacterized protein
MQPFVSGKLLRIFVDRDERWHGRPLYAAIVDLLREEGARGASVFVGAFGSGTRGVPVLIEVIDEDAAIERVLPHLDDMIAEGAVTLERVDFVQTRRPAPS